MNHKQLVVWLLSQPTPLRQFLEVNKSTAGRDKVYRLIQYICRYLGWQLKRRGYPGGSQLILSLAALESQFSNGRKLMRLFKSVDFLLEAQAAWNKPAPTWLRVLRTASEANRALRMLFDHIQWAGSNGVFGPSGRALAPRLGEISNLFWFLGGLTSVTLQLQALAALQGAKGADARRRRQALLVDLLREVLDLPISAFGANLLPKSVETGHVGVLGVVSSVIGLYQVWTATYEKMAGAVAAAAAKKEEDGNNSSNNSNAKMQ